MMYLFIRDLDENATLKKNTRALSKRHLVHDLESCASQKVRS